MAEQFWQSVFNRTLLQFVSLLGPVGAPIVDDSSSYSTQHSQPRAQTFEEFQDSVIGFFHAIDWKEPFIQSLLAFHVAWFGIAFFFRKYNFPLATVWILSLVSARMGEYINGWGAAHWREFATQNYFDRGGVFVSILWCSPLLILSFLITLKFLLDSYHMLVIVKRAELREQIKNREQRQRREGGGGGGGKDLKEQGGKEKST